MSKHQPGPWQVEVLDNETIIEGPHYTVCTNVSNDDADIIATAPDMYKGLKEVEKVFNVTNIDPLQAFVMIERVKYLIDKAEGKIK